MTGIVDAALQRLLFKKVSQLNMPNAIAVGLAVQLVHRHHILWVIVLYHLQVAELTLHGLL